MGGDYDEEFGIPGHAAKSDWASKLQSFLKDLGVPFEAEGEATRIRLYEGVLAEVREAEEGGYAVEVSIPLPGECTGGCDLDYHVEAYRAALRLLAGLGSTLAYYLDDSIPGYPILRARATFDNPYDLADRLAEAVRAYFGGAKAGQRE